MARFGRLVTAMVTPFSNDLQVDLRQAAALARHLVATGSDALVVAGTTGESPTLSVGERLALFEAVVDAVGDQVPVLAGTGSNSTAETIALSKKAEVTGVAGLLLVGPYYNKPTQEGYYRHFAAVAQATRLPLMIYNVPGRTASNIEPATLLRLAADYANVVAVKESSGDLDQAAELVAGGLEVYTGNDNELLPALAVGCAGVVSVAAHVAGPPMQQLIQAYLEGQVALAGELHRRLLPLFKGLFATTNPILVKAALAEVGWPVGGLRLPLVEATQTERDAVRELLLRVGIQ